jgi:hypothetical protein
MSASALRFRTATAVVVLAGISCASPSAWNELDSVEDLKAAFERDSGKARIVLLLSPT